MNYIEYIKQEESKTITKLPTAYKLTYTKTTIKFQFNPDKPQNHDLNELKYYHTPPKGLLLNIYA